MNNKSHIQKRNIKTSVMLTQEERDLLTVLAIRMKATFSEVIRAGIIKVNESYCDEIIYNEMGSPDSIWAQPDTDKKEE